MLAFFEETDNLPSTPCIQWAALGGTLLGGAGEEDQAMAEVKQESSDNAEVATYSSELKDALAWVRENAQGKCVHETQLIELQILFDRRSQRADLKSWRDSALLRKWNVQRQEKSEDGSGRIETSCH